MEDIVREYGFKRDHLKIIHPAIRKTAPVTYVNGYVEVFNIDHSIEREATMADYEFNWGQIVRRSIRPMGNSGHSGSGRVVRK
jgi:GDP-D-mannose dehydratase